MHACMEEAHVVNTNEEEEEEGRTRECVREQELEKRRVRARGSTKSPHVCAYAHR